MKTVYYSDVLNKTFNSKEECLDAEREYRLKKTAEEERTKIKNKEKEELSNKIDEADKEIEKLHDEHEKVKEEARIIIKEAEDKAAELFKQFYLKLDKASEKRMLLIKEFNEKYGSDVKDSPYQTYMNVVNKLKHIFNDWL